MAVLCYKITATSPGEGEGHAYEKKADERYPVTGCAWGF